MSDVRSVVEDVEQAVVEGEGGGGVIGDDDGQREGCRVHSATLKGDARTSVSKRGRAGDDADARGRIAGVEDYPRGDLARALEVGNGGEAEGVDIC